MISVYSLSVVNKHRERNMSDKDKWEFYTDKAGNHRWRRTATNGQIVGAACQGYKKKSACMENARRNGYSG